jgi:hypothetical protein
MAIPTPAEVRDALNDLRRAGYSANSHPTRPDCVVVNDPVHCSGGEDGIHIKYEHRTLRVAKVWDFIDARS